ncbi:hypothetical protein PQX77_014975 [Marasmius sp. AFHP31]|nr:hypothetical protein PQX77_014975 [Marasmius sp. AFHP31]
MDRIHLSKNLLFICTFLSFFSGHAKADCTGPARRHLSARGDNSTQSWNESSWGMLEPSKELRWVECYREVGEFECARLQVPLNYHEPEGETAAIALTRLAANVSSDSPDYRGPILFNPGGPGDSGVDYLVGSAPSLRATIGPEYDLIGFDPRGIQRSTPRIEFYASREERQLVHRPANELNSSTMDVGHYWASTKIMGSLAAQRDKERNVLAHLNTDHSARDMLSIAEAHGREKVQYWGLSYGSVLGYTFASMFPDKVERIVIDAIVDPEDYYRTQWLTGTQDTGKALRWFFESCLKGGSESCAFYEDSVEAMESKLNDIYASVIKSPIPVQGSISNGIVDYAHVRGVLFISLYHPFSAWPILAKALQDLKEGNATTIWSGVTGEVPPFECDCDSSKYEFERLPEGLMGYMCNDGDAVPPEFEAAQAHYEASADYSPFGSFFASFRLSCNGWSKDIPKAQFRGPIAGNTSFPMMIIGNTADPATPLEAAKNVSSTFPGSVVLTQDSPGHGSVNAPSVCTAKAIRAYFINGTLPEEGTICPMDGSPFDPKETEASGQTESKRDLSSDDGHLLEHLRRLARRGFIDGFTPLV